MYKILAVGNSLTADTTRWFGDLAMNEEGYAKVVTLLANGRHIEVHGDRVVDGVCDYEIFINGVCSRLKGGLNTVVPTDKWTHVMIQEPMPAEKDKEKIREACHRLRDYFRLMAPDAKMLLLSTWFFPGETPKEEWSAATEERWETAKFAAAELGIPESNIVPAGRIINELSLAELPNLFRDEIHLTLSEGRYLAAQTLYSFLSGKSAKSDFRGFRAPVIEEDFLFKTLHNMTFAPANEADIEKGQETIDRYLFG